MTFIHSIHHADHRAIYQLFIPFVIHEEKFGTNNHHLILLGIQSSSLLTKRRSLLKKSGLVDPLNASDSKLRTFRNVEDSTAGFSEMSKVHHGNFKDLRLFNDDNKIGKCIVCYLTFKKGV